LIRRAVGSAWVNAHNESHLMHNQPHRSPSRESFKPRTSLGKADLSTGDAQYISPSGCLHNEPHLVGE